jgi:hypothetical protein
MILLFALILGCGGDGSEGSKPRQTPDRSEASGQNTGTIVFEANGEDFVRRGFTDRGGWRIQFDQLMVNLADPTAYTSDGSLQAVLAGDHWIDLAAGDENAAPIEVGRLNGVTAANYQSLKFSLARRRSGEHEGFTIVMIGKASKDGQEIPFRIRLDEQMLFDGREGYVGDEVKGVLKPGDETRAEMTFHFDHIFGDSEAASDDHINTGSVGFDFFYGFERGGSVDTTQSELKEAPEYPTLVRSIWTLGHLGEGHCEVSGQSSRAEIPKR